MSGKTNLKISVLVAAFSLTIVSSAMSRTIYVDDDVNGVNDGTSWENAYNFLQDALADANSAVKPVEIRVAQGTYRPDESTLHQDGTGDRTATFQLINGVTIKGGYAGFGEPDPNARDIELYETILSGDLNGDDGPNFINNGENSFHVITGTDTDETAIINGFTITGGNANGVSLFSRFGGGMLAETHYHWSNPTVTNCKFIENSAVWGGGLGGGDGLIYKCIISGNKAESSGGGVCSWRGPIRYCIIEKNRSDRGGGGIGEGYGCDIFSCIIRENSAEWTGGGIRNPTGYICNCIISNNSARWGGGIYNDGDTTVLTNCTFTDNQGSGIYAGSDDDSAIVVMTNCIFWNDNYDEDYGSTFIMNYNCFQDLPDDLDGIGNIVADPCFVSIGYWDSNGVWVNGDYHLLRGSPCIDAGDPNYVPEPNETDFDGRPRVINGRIDMGAYEYSPPISAEVRIVPRVVNLKSKGKWINAFLWLPEDYSVIDIDTDSFLLEGEIEPQWLRIDEEKQVVIAMFSREEVRDILTIGEVELTITGRLTDGTVFEAKDVIIVIDKGSRKSAKQEKKNEKIKKSTSKTTQKTS